MLLKARAGRVPRMGDSHGPDRSCSLKWGANQPALRGSGMVAAENQNPFPFSSPRHHPLLSTAGSQGQGAQGKLPGTQSRVAKAGEWVWRISTHLGALGTVLSTLPAFTHLILTTAQGQVEQYALFNLFLLSFSLFGWVHTWN